MARVTIVGSSTVPLIEDTPDVIQQSVLGSIINGTNIATDIMNTLTNTYSHKVKRAYEYARRDYYYGLPEGSIGRFVVDNDLIKSVLKQFVVLGADEDIEIVAANIDNLDATNFVVEYYRNNNPDFDITNLILPNVTFEYYLNSEGNESPASDPKTFPARVDGITRVIDETHIRVRLYHDQYEENEVTGQNEVVRRWVAWATIPIENSDYNKVIEGIDQYYYFVEYFIFNKVTGTHIGANYVWNYWEGSFRFPELDETREVIDQNYYMPIVPIRINNKMLTGEDSYETRRYKTSKELLNILGIDIHQLHEGVLDNPDVEKIDHAYVVLGANLFSEKKETIRYIHEFIKYLYGANGDSDLIITDETYKIKLTWDKIIALRKSGIIGKVGTVEKEIGIDPTKGRYLRTKKQETSDSYQEFTWYEPVLHNYIYYTSKSVTTALDAIDTDADEAFIIPLNISIVENNLTPIQANTLYYDALKLVFNSYERKRLKWYQTGIFRAVTMVIAVAISIVTYGAGSAFVGMLVGIVINMALEIIYDLVVTIFGEEAGAAVMAVITIIAIYYGYTSGFIPDIGQVINIAINAASFSFGNFIAMKTEEVMEEFREFQETVKEKMTTLEEVQSQFDQKFQKDPLGFYGNVGMVPGQSIDQFYYSKLQLPINYGTSCFELLSNWVDNQLQLPHLMR